MERGLKPYVFCEDGEKGRKTYNRLRRKFDGAVEQSGIKRRTLHDLRRTVGSLLAERGVNQKVAAEVLGHSDPRTTARYYQAVRPETIKAAIVNLRPTGTENDKSNWNFVPLWCRYPLPGPSRLAPQRTSPAA